MTSHQVESNANTALGKLLQPMLGRAVVRAQHSSVIVEHPPVAAGCADYRAIGSWSF